MSTRDLVLRSKGWYDVRILARTFEILRNFTSAKTLPHCPHCDQLRRNQREQGDRNAPFQNCVPLVVRRRDVGMKGDPDAREHDHEATPDDVPDRPTTVQIVA